MAVIWITGISGVGKSTLAKELVQMLQDKAKPVLALDGDELREIFAMDTNSGFGHNRNERLSLAFKYSKLCQMIANQRETVVIATISLFREIHEWNRKNLPNYIEVYLKVPLDELRQRDPKNIYKNFDAGKIENVAGLDLSIDEPLIADFIAEYNPTRSAKQLAEELMEFIIKKGVI